LSGIGATHNDPDSASAIRGWLARANAMRINADDLKFVLPGVVKVWGRMEGLARRLANS
jgi:hypothetical protein